MHGHEEAFNTNHGIKESIMGYQICNINQTLIFDEWVNVRRVLYTYLNHYLGQHQYVSYEHHWIFLHEYEGPCIKKYEILITNTQAVSTKYDTGPTSGQSPCRAGHPLIWVLESVHKVSRDFMWEVVVILLSVHVSLSLYTYSTCFDLSRKGSSRKVIGCSTYLGLIGLQF